MTSTIDTAIKNINAIRKQIADIEKRLVNVRNIREYDQLTAEKQIAMYDMQTAVNELNRCLGIAIEINDEHLSNAADNIVTRTFINRMNETATA